MKKAGKLSQKIKLFVAEYLIDGNGTRAAIAAGYSKNGARVRAVKMLARPDVSAMLSKAREKQLDWLAKIREETHRELYHALTRKASDFVDETGELRSIPNMPEQVQGLIDGIEQETRVNLETGERTTKTKIKISPKAPAVDMALKVMGSYAPQKIDMEHSGLLQIEALRGQLADDNERLRSIGVVGAGVVAAGDGEPGPVRANGQPGPMAMGKAPEDAKRSAVGGSNGNGAAAAH
jgi:phage terminase small subunit